MNLKDLVEKIEVCDYVINFDGNEEQWQSNYFKLMSLKNTYSGCLRLTVFSNYSRGDVWISLVVKAEKDYVFSSFVYDHFINVSKSCYKAYILDAFSLLKPDDDVLDIFLED